MKILLVHNFYREPGGEDIVFAQERQLLERKGHTVVSYTRTNEEADQSSIIQRGKLLKTIVSASKSRQDLAEILRSEPPDIVHVHNTFMMISPSIYDVCDKANVATVQTLHNYRLACPAATLFREGRVCEECITGGLMQGVRHGCYRGSRTTTAAVAVMLKTHRERGTWNSKVSAFIALTGFAKDKMVESGLPAEKIYVKPNFVERDPGARKSPGTFALFVGRVSPEKGLSTLLRAWELLKIPVPLKIIGDGPAKQELELFVQTRGIKDVEFLGRVDSCQTREVMKQAAFLVLPSLWYEGFPMVLAESFSCGVPVLGSRLGAMEELIDDGQNGIHFTPGEPEDLARKVTWAWGHPENVFAMGNNARRKFESSYGAEENYDLLMKIYGNAMASIR
jgi:glycosyltransferase involved in cell wall biosynthesis